MGEHTSPVSKPREEEEERKEREEVPSGATRLTLKLTHSHRAGSEISSSDITLSTLQLTGKIWFNNNSVHTGKEAESYLVPK